MTDVRKSVDEPVSSPGASSDESVTAVSQAPSTLKVPTIRESKTSSERVKLLLDSLEGLDSVYICHIDKPFPAEVAKKVPKRCVQKYEIKDYFGVTRYYAAELTSCSSYYLCSSSRSFQIYMYDLNGMLLFESVRYCNKSLCLCGLDCWCSGGVETVANLKKGQNYIGSVVSLGSCSTPRFKVHNGFWEELYYIRGPKNAFIWPCKLCFIEEFPICLPKTDISVGKIMHGYDGLQEDRIPNPKTVGVIFPPRCTAESKACLLTAGFMLDVTYFEKRGCTLHRILRYLFKVCLVGVFLLGCFYIVYSSTMGKE